MRILKKNQSGFTLVELLVVIAILGLLSTIVMTSLTGARKKARDTRRVADLRQLNTAIQFYINDNGHAPYVGTMNCAPDRGDSSCSTVTEVNSGAWKELEGDLSQYIAKLPEDPCGESCYDGSTRKYFSYVYMPPGAVSNWCGCIAGEEEYAVYAENMEVASSTWNMTYAGVPTFGFINHQLGSSF